MFGWPDCLEAELIYFDIHFPARHCNKFQLQNEICSVAVNCSPLSRPPSGQLRARNSLQLSSIVTMRTLTLIALAALLAVVVARAGPGRDKAERKPGAAAGRKRVDPDAMTDAEGEEFEKVRPKN
ncbi:hypothetical protein WR25_06289 [Diploscapter pachys]|uniref:Uncharacterized protein n=1 Tax=Diploscapter pachys TaxID=2018661 RepID=A0A2A2LRR9_9BILA|nr:hypothetical protein WR25_06289 [Diploscapter pachys]